MLYLSTISIEFVFFFSTRRRHTRCALVTGVQTCALPIFPSAELTAARPARQAIVEIDCADGRRLSHRTRTVLGTPDNPMTEAQVEAKARDLIAPVLGDTQTEALIAALRARESLDDVRTPRPLLQA